eukprot:gene5602-11299_t
MSSKSPKRKLRVVESIPKNKKSNSENVNVQHESPGARSLYQPSENEVGYTDNDRRQDIRNLRGNRRHRPNNENMKNPDHRRSTSSPLPDMSMLKNSSPSTSPNSHFGDNVQNISQVQSDVSDISSISILNNTHSSSSSNDNQRNSPISQLNESLSRPSRFRNPQLSVTPPMLSLNINNIEPNNNHGENNQISTNMMGMDVVLSGTEVQQQQQYQHHQQQHNNNNNSNNLFTPRNNSNSCNDFFYSPSSSTDGANLSDIREVDLGTPVPKYGSPTAIHGRELDIDPDHINDHNGGGGLLSYQLQHHIQLQNQPQTQHQLQQAYSASKARKPTPMKSPFSNQHHQHHLDSSGNKLSRSIFEQGAISSCRSLNSSYCPPTPTRSINTPQRDSIHETLHSYMLLYESATHTNSSGSPSVSESLSVSFQNDFTQSGPPIGSGNFADVFPVKDHINGHDFAIKKLKHSFTSVNARVCMMREVDIMTLVCKEYCPYILQLIRAWQEDGYLFLQLGLAERGTLLDLMKSMSHRREFFPERTLWHILHDVTSGLQHIHKCGIVHLDIKPANLLISGDFKIMIGDFGNAYKLENIIVSSDGVEGDTCYMAIELLMNEVIVTTAADVFSLGLTLYELWNFIPYEDHSYCGLTTGGEEWHDLRENRVPPLREVELHHASPVLRSTIPDMLRWECAERPSIETLLAIEQVQEAGRRSSSSCSSGGGGDSDPVLMSAVLVSSSGIRLTRTQSYMNEDGVVVNGIGIGSNDGSSGDGDGDGITMALDDETRAITPTPQMCSLAHRFPTGPTTPFHSSRATAATTTAPSSISTPISLIALSHANNHSVPRTCPQPRAWDIMPEENCYSFGFIRVSTPTTSSRINNSNKLHTQSQSSPSSNVFNSRSQSSSSSSIMHRPNPILLSSSTPPTTTSFSSSGGVAVAVAAVKHPRSHSHEIEHERFHLLNSIHSTLFSSADVDVDVEAMTMNMKVESNLGDSEGMDLSSSSDASRESSKTRRSGRSRRK